MRRLISPSTILILSIMISSCVQKVENQDYEDSLNQEISIGHLGYVDSMVQDYLTTNRLAGGVYLVSHKGEIIKESAFGYKDLANEEKQKESDLFRIASMTKPITAIAALQLLEKGKFGMEDPLWWHLPEFRKMEILEEVNMVDSSYTSRKAENEIRVKHLFNHTSGIGYGFQDDKLNAIYLKAEISEGFEERAISNEENTKRIASVPLMHEPGEKWTYGLSFDVLGRLIEVLSGQSLDDYFKEHIFSPLGMNDTHFYLPEKDFQRLSTVYESSHDGIRETSYELINYPVAGAKMYYSGGADLTSTARDYARFAQMIMNDGELDGRRIISSKTIDWMTRQQLEGGKDGFGWGFGLVEEDSEMNHVRPAGSNSWGGFFGTHCLMDPENELIVILMIQQYPNWEWNITDKLHNIIYASIIEN